MDRRRSSSSSIAICVVVMAMLHAVSADPVRARAYVFKSSQDISQPLQSIGVLDFSQYGGYVKINGTISDLTPGKHGFHVHEKGDLGNGCLNAGSHFNPTEQSHGGQNDTVRHVGDLGNLDVPASGIANIELEDSVIALHGPYSVIGRSIVIHEKADDLGRGNTEASRTTGDSGSRIACGLIGITEEADHPLQEPIAQAANWNRNIISVVPIVCLCVLINIFDYVF